MKTMINDVFSTEALFNPDNRFYPVYSWMWNEALSKDEIKRQLDKMYERNIRGVYVIPLPSEFRPKTMSTNLSPEYLSDGYFDMLSYAADYAASRNMTFWLYDEGGWPSGNAGNRVTKNDGSLKLKYLRKGLIRKSEKADLTSLKATEKFISLTHEQHKSKMGKSFTHLGPLVFTDEPDIGALPFTESIRREYRRRTGKRLSKYKLSKHNDPELNILYHDICADAFAENYFLPIKKWCNSNSLLSAGHLDKDNEPYGFRKSFHHPLRILRCLDVPGVDVIWGQITPDRECGFFPRLASSAAEQTGSGLSLSESLSVYGTLTYDRMRYILGYQLIRGISIFNIMLLMYDESSYYSIRQRPMFSEKLPGGEFLAEFNRYIASLQYIMHKSKPDTESALYLPMRSLWADDKHTPSAMESYEEMGRSIERHHGQFDIIDDDLILGCNDEKLKKGIIAMGRAEYRAVYIPADKYMPDDVRKRLEIFRHSGGRIYDKSNAEYSPKLHITGDNGALRVHKRIFGSCEIYLVFNESSEKVKAEFHFSDKIKELDLLRREICTVTDEYCFESGEIKAFVTGLDMPYEKKSCLRGKKICTLKDFKVKKQKQFTVDIDGMSYEDNISEETDTVIGEWTELYGRDFSGRCQYRAEFTYKGEGKNLILSLGQVNYCCDVFLNGRKIADLFMPPYETVIDKSLIKENNELIINVSNTAANAFVSFDLPKEWEQKHIGPYHERALVFERELLSGGLIGPVEIFEAE